MDEITSLNYRAVAAIAFTGIVLLIVAFGTFSAVLKAKGPKEKAFLIRTCFGFWFFLILVGGLLWSLSPNLRYGILAAYFVLLPISIYRSSVRAQLIRGIDEHDLEAANESETAEK